MKARDLASFYVFEVHVLERVLSAMCSLKSDAFPLTAFFKCILIFQQMISYPNNTQIPVAKPTKNMTWELVKDPGKLFTIHILYLCLNTEAGSRPWLNFCPMHLNPLVHFTDAIWRPFCLPMSSSMALTWTVIAWIGACTFHWCCT